MGQTLTAIGELNSFWLIKAFSKVSDHIARLRRQGRAFAGRTYYIVIGQHCLRRFHFGTVCKAYNPFIPITPYRILWQTVKT